MRIKDLERRPRRSADILRLIEKRSRSTNQLIKRDRLYRAEVWRDAQIIPGVAARKVDTLTFWRGHDGQLKCNERKLSLWQRFREWIRK